MIDPGNGTVVTDDPTVAGVSFPASSPGQVSVAAWSGTWWNRSRGGRL
jgi:hypothetical protein